MSQLELDHVFICVQPEAPEAEFLKNFGLTEGSRRIHHGQGTANICFFFQNAYLELLWLNEHHEIQSPLVRPLNLWERCHWKKTQACPFGISLRKATPDLVELPFTTWNYHAQYLPTGAFIPIVTAKEHFFEPLVFISPSTKRPANYSLEKQRPLVHQLGFQEITGLQVILPRQINLSPELTTLIDLGLVEFSPGDFYHLEIEFDGGQQGKLQNFESILPISIKW